MYTYALILCRGSRYVCTGRHSPSTESLGPRVGTYDPAGPVALAATIAAPRAVLVTQRYLPLPTPSTSSHVHPGLPCPGHASHASHASSHSLPIPARPTLTYLTPGLGLGLGLGVSPSRPSSPVSQSVSHTCNTLDPTVAHFHLRADPSPFSKHNQQQQLTSRISLHIKSHLLVTAKIIAPALNISP